MRDGHLVRINGEKHHIKLLNDNTQPAHAAFYRAWPTTKEYEKIEIEKMLKANAIELAQTE